MRKNHFNSTKKHNCGTVAEPYLNNEHYQMRIHEQGHTQSDMEEFDRTAVERKNYTSTGNSCSLFFFGGG